MRPLILLQLLRRSDGNVLMLTGLAVLMMFAAGGAGIDLGRQQMVRTKLQNASDAAAIAAASMSETATPQQRENRAQRYFELNYPETYMGVPRPEPQIEVTADSISVRATADVPAKFINNLGIENLSSGSATKVALSSTAASGDYDVVVIIDESGSTGAAAPPSGGYPGSVPPGAPGSPGYEPPPPGDPGETWSPNCFVGDVTITLADGSSKAVSELEAGDEVRSQSGTNKVLKVPSFTTKSPLYGFNGGKKFVTGGHPFMTKEGWKAIDPALTPTEGHNVKTTALAVGDVLIGADGKDVTLVSIDHGEAGEHTVYNPVVDGDHTYFANGLLVHNKRMDEMPRLREYEHYVQHEVERSTFEELLAWVVSPAYAQATRTIMDVEKDALRTMVTSLLSSGNKNVRVGVVGYTGCISTKGGLTSDMETALGYISRLRSRFQNFDHYGMEAGANMVNARAGSGSLAECDAGEGSVDLSEDFYTYSVQQNTGVPGPVTARTDGRMSSPNKIIVFLTDGYIMVEPPGCDGSGGPCPNYQVFVDSCNQAKAEGTIIYTIGFVSNAPGDEGALRNCASDDGKGGKRYFFAPDEATLKTVLGNVGSAIRKIQVVE